MKTLPLVLLIGCFGLFTFLGAQNQSESKKYGLYPGAQYLNSTLTNDSMPVNIFRGEWLGGLKGGLISTAGLGVSVYLVYLSYGGPMSKELGPGGFVVGLLGTVLSLASIPILVTGGVDRAARRIHVQGKYGLGFTGALVSGAACLALNLAFLGNNASLAFVTIPVSTLVLIPAATAYFYNGFGKSAPIESQASLFNIHSGNFGLGAPTPVVYRNPVMGGKVCTQFSLLSVSF